MSRRRRRRSNRPTWLVVVILAVLVLVGARLVQWGGGHVHAPETAQTETPTSVGGPFTLVNGDEKTVTDQDFQGKFLLIYFGYTFCPDICPTELGAVAKALDALTPEQRERIVPLFITIDPERDTPAVLKTYTAAFHPQIVGLTGTPEQIEQVRNAYHIYAAKVPGSDDKTYAMDHSSVLYLMGPDGAYLTHFNRNATLDQIVEDLRKRLS